MKWRQLPSSFRSTFMRISTVEKSITSGLAISFCCSSIFAALELRIGAATISAAGGQDGGCSNCTDWRNHHDRLHASDCRQAGRTAAMDLRPGWPCIDALGLLGRRLGAAVPA